MRTLLLDLKLLAMRRTMGSRAVPHPRHDIWNPPSGACHQVGPVMSTNCPMIPARFSFDFEPSLIVQRSEEQPVQQARVTFRYAIPSFLYLKPFGSKFSTIAFCSVREPPLLYTALGSSPWNISSLRQINILFSVEQRLLGRLLWNPSFRHGPW